MATTIYSGSFVERILMLPKGSVFAATANTDQPDLREWGQVEYRGRPVGVYAAEDLSVWIVDRLQKSIGVLLSMQVGLDLSPGKIETLLSRARPGAIEKYLRTGPIVWLSNLAHHGGRTECK